MHFCWGQCFNDQDSTYFDLLWHLCCFPYGCPRESFPLWLFGACVLWGYLKLVISYPVLWDFSSLHKALSSAETSGHHKQASGLCQHKSSFGETSPTVPKVPYPPELWALTPQPLFPSICEQMPHVHVGFPTFSSQEVKSSAYHSSMAKSMGSGIGILAWGLCSVLWDVWGWAFWSDYSSSGISVLVTGALGQWLAKTKLLMKE